MLHKIYSIYDEKSKVFSNPTVARTRGDYLRSLSAALAKDTDSVFSTNSEDFFIYEIGSWDTESGFILNISETDRENLGRVSDYK